MVRLLKPILVARISRKTRAERRSVVNEITSIYVATVYLTSSPMTVTNEVACCRSHPVARSYFHPIAHVPYSALSPIPPLLCISAYKYERAEFSNTLRSSQLIQCGRGIVSLMSRDESELLARCLSAEATDSDGESG